jgi:hypothetical protein
MKDTIKRILILSAFLPLAACVETTSPLCDSSNKTNVPDLKESYKISMLMVGKDSASFSEQGLTFKNTGTGEYDVDGGAGPQHFSTCKVGSWHIAETKNSFGTYQQTILSAKGDGSMTQSQFIIDPNTLKQMGVNFSIVERQEPKSQKQWRQFFGANDDEKKYSVIVINNDNSTATEIVRKIGMPFAIGFTLH